MGPTKGQVTQSSCWAGFGKTLYSLFYLRCIHGGNTYNIIKINILPEVKKKQRIIKWSGEKTRYWWHEACFFLAINWNLSKGANYRTVCLPTITLFDQSIPFFFSPFIFISWRLITLQYCSGFCHTLTWITHGFTCIPHPDPPSYLPLHQIPLGLPSAPDPSTCLMHPTWAADLFHPR